MPIVNVRFMGNLREAARAEYRRLTIKESSRLKDLFDQLVDEAVDEEAKIKLGAALKSRGRVIALINGVEAGFRGGLGLDLRDGDEITLIPVSHGG